ncbi:MAG: phosphatase PAP2 family protein [Enterococcus sp.]
MNTFVLELIGFLFLLLFIGIGFIIKQPHHWIHRFDQQLTRVIRQSYPKRNRFYLFITKLANPTSVVIQASIYLLFLYMNHYYTEASWFAAGVIGIAAIFNPLVKIVYARTRPSLDPLVIEKSFSYPSGHSLGSMVLFGSLICLIPILFQNLLLIWVLRLLLSALILNIGISRVYLGVHYPSDVCGGFCVGLAWLFLSYPFF